ncbi:MAG: DUF971 domain-containing protein [Elusimicrobia bacterium]|nr:DUF971 domain-containing protein [Elusimicrobiota bacterium]
MKIPIDEPQRIESAAQRELRITWKDGHESVYGYAYLRRLCRCALCRHEWTGQPMLDPKSIPDDLKALKVFPRGNYALSFDFSDGHTTGIYSFEFLRQICPCPDCVRRSAFS